MSLTERKALRNIIRRRLELLEMIQLALEPMGLLEGTCAPAGAETPGGQATGSDAPGGTSLQMNISSCSPHEPVLPKDEPNNDANTTEHTASPGKTQPTGPTLPLNAASPKHSGPPPSAPRLPIEPAPTEAEMEKFRAYHRTLQRILGAADRATHAVRETHRQRTADRWAAAAAAERLHRRSKGPRRRRWVMQAVVDWADDARPGVGWEPEVQEETDDELGWGRRLGPSRLAKGGVTPDDWIWEEGWREAGAISAAGYAYRRDGEGRRVHHL